MNALGIFANQAYAAVRDHRNTMLGRNHPTEKELDVVGASVEVIHEMLEAALLHAERVLPPVEAEGEA